MSCRGPYEVPNARSHTGGQSPARLPTSTSRQHTRTQPGAERPSTIRRLHIYFTVCQTYTVFQEIERVGVEGGGGGGQMRG